jgi:hypothetical protein
LRLLRWSQRLLLLLLLLRWFRLWELCRRCLLLCCLQARC